jgi:hypothetical protein
VVITIKKRADYSEIMQISKGAGMAGSKTKLDKRKEAEFRSWLKGKWPGWSCVIEFGMGGEPGAADIVLADPKYPEMQHWCELKIGEVRNGILISTEVRPDQIGWAAKARMAGVSTALVVGVQEGPGDWTTFVVKQHHMKMWKTGWLVGPVAEGFTSMPGVINWLRQSAGELK